MGVEFQVP